MNGFRWGAAGVVLGVAVALMMPLGAQEPSPGQPAERAITVGGTGTIRSAPDEAVVLVGVRTEADRAEEAMRSNASRMENVVGALTGSGIRRDDIATSEVSLNPRYDFNGERTTGYVAVNQVSATVRDLDRIGKVIDDAVAAGANLTGGISFRLSERNRGVNEALEEALRDARAKAEALAEAAGARLGRVVSVQETGSVVPPPVYQDRAVAEAAETPVLPPTLESQVSVSVTWELS